MWNERREVNAGAAEVRAVCEECELPFERLRSGGVAGRAFEAIGGRI